MVNKIPESWKYDDSLEMLFLFYQCADELLSEMTPDTYSLPLHNCITLLEEINEVYQMIKQYNLFDPYYRQYIPPIIEEFLEQTEDDYLLKKILGQRLSSIRTGFLEAISSDNHLEKWINIFKQSCNYHAYLTSYKNEIINLIVNTKDKDKLIYCTKNYFICLISLGYSREYLYISTKKFFDNRKNPLNSIDSSKQIQEYLKLFTCKEQTFDFLVLMDTENIDYLDSISRARFNEAMQKVDIPKKRKELAQDSAAMELFKEYDKKIHNANSHQNVCIVDYSSNALDPYSVAINLENTISFFQVFSRYFKHFNKTKQVFNYLVLNSSGHYNEIRIPKRIHKRPYVEQEIIDQRIINILTGKSMEMNAFRSITHAIEMHSEAFDSNNVSISLRILWTALETLFSNPIPGSERDNVINSIIPIIQKTYLLKLLRVLHSQLKQALSKNELEALGIYEFDAFVEYFSSHKENSSEMKIIYNYLSTNPLLRSRLFGLRKKVGSGSGIAKVLEIHQKRINWQLLRIKRIRNIATHLGFEATGIHTAMNHLHNYFDYMINYMLCKSENGDLIVSTSTVVSEAKNDNTIYFEVLKGNEALSQDNYIDYLFGPDHSIANYDFE